jgi:hypothetical protein
MWPLTGSTTVTPESESASNDDALIEEPPEMHRTPSIHLHTHISHWTVNLINQHFRSWWPYTLPTRCHLPPLPQGVMTWNVTVLISTATTTETLNHSASDSRGFWL